MATDTTLPQEAHSAPLQPTSDATNVLGSSLAQRIANYRGKSFSLLVYMLKTPDSYWADACKAVSVSDSYSYELRKQPGYEALLQEIRSRAGDLRSEYAQAAMREAVPGLADAMIARGMGAGRDAQRAGERILETVGVLSRPGTELPAPNVQVNTFTYYLVQPGQEPRPFMVETNGAKGAIVEGVTRELPAPKT